MDLKRLETSLKGIRHLLSHLHSEVTTLGDAYFQVLHALRSLEGAYQVDELTGLLRRGAFFKKWQDLLEECQRVNDSCGVLMIDIDHFKSVNDTHGHPTGDEVLRRIAELLKRFESPNCITGRYGGEEFIVAIRGNDAEVLGVAEMIRRGAERLHGPVIKKNSSHKSDSHEISRPGLRRISSVQWKCTLSVGIATAKKEGFSATRLLEVADQALYRAKRKGRNQVCAA